MKGKSSKRNTSKIDSNKIATEVYIDMNDFKEKPVTMNFLRRLLFELQEYIQDERVYKLTPFFYGRGICYDNIRRWRERYPEFDKGYEHCKYVVGDRREQHMLQRKINDKVGMFMQGRYDPEWRERELELNKENQSNSKEYIVLKDLGKSDLVPKKEE